MVWAFSAMIPFLTVGETGVRKEELGYMTFISLSVFITPPVTTGQHLKTTLKEHVLLRKNKLLLE